MAQLDKDIAFFRNAFQQHRAQEGPEWIDEVATLLATLHYNRFNQRGDMSDLQQALALQHTALDQCPQGHPHRARSLGKIATFLYVRFHHLGVLPDLEEAISLEQQALELRPKGDADRNLSLGNLANSFFTRFQELGALSDLEEALSLQRNALELRPSGHPLRAISLTNIATCLHARFLQFGSLSDLEEALTTGRSALELLPEGHCNQSLTLRLLGSCLHARFNQLGALSDLEEALSLRRHSLTLCPPGHPDRARSLSSIAISLGTRFDSLRELPDLEEAIALERNALELRPPGHPVRASSLYNIATYLHTRFTQLRTLPDLDEALSLQRSALALQPPGHSVRAFSLGNLATHLRIRFNELGVLSDLEEAISLERSALELSPKGDPKRALSLGSLASHIHTRFKHAVNPDVADLDEAFNLFVQLSQVSQAVSLADLKCTEQWIQTAEEGKHRTTVLAYQTFLRLSVKYLATLPSLPQHLALLKELMKSTAIDAFSACLRSGNGALAVELLEQGRGVFWNQLIRLRSPLDEVKESSDGGRELVDQFSNVASLLRSILDSPTDAHAQHDRAFHLNLQLQDVVARIRKLPGHAQFLQPPQFSDLQEAAVGGPVIIVNASRHSCDALVLLVDRDPVHIPLQVTKNCLIELASQVRSLASRAKFSDVKRDFVILLRELWEVVVFPVVEVIQASCPHGSRIWWCPTAEFYLLPLHAAGSYRKNEQNLSDLYISSYTPTLTALIRARRARELYPPKKQPRFLLIGQAQAAGQNELVSVNSELSSISKRMESIASVTCVRDEDATITKVGDELRKNDFVHFACHGIPDRKHPFESGFAIGDGLLKVETIMQYDLQNAQFAYLSACHTTVGDDDGPDESIHLAAAMQFAGFSSVIGTMWAVDDSHTKEITSKFYARMLDESGRLDHTRAAVALHKTTRSLRPDKVQFDQRILYVHIGA